MGITQLFGSRNFVVVNKTLIKLLGLEEAVILGELASEYDYWESNGQLDDEGYFFSTVENVEENTSLTKYRQKKALDTLQKLGIVDVKRKGLPAKRYIKIYEEALLNLLDNKKSKNLTSGSEEILPLEIKNFDRNNNNNNNNNDNNNNRKKERKKEASENFDSIISDFANGDKKLESLLKDFLQLRFMKKQPVTNSSLNTLLDKLNVYAYDILPPMFGDRDNPEREYGRTCLKRAVVEKSLVNGYSDFYRIENEEEINRILEMSYEEYKNTPIGSTRTDNDFQLGEVET